MFSHRLYILNIFSNLSVSTSLTACSNFRNFFHKQNYNKNMGVSLNTILEKLQSFAPLKLAESWDNVGLLVAPNTENSVINSVLLTIDLTEEVVDEAIKTDSKLIVSYHPNIFRPIKNVTQRTWKEKVIIKCIKNDIFVFSPHTTWDAIKDGVNDWLGSAFNLRSSKPILINQEDTTIGMGRLLDLEQPITLRNAIQLVKQHVSIPHVRFGLGKNKTLESMVNTVALCAGSGASVLNGIDADLYLTGEMLHHDVLDATQKGISVILCNHSDSERGFLKHFKEKIQDEQVHIFVSEIDRDCLTVV